MDLVDPRVAAYLAALVPPADSVRAKMEAYGAERRFPLVGPVVGAVCWQYAVAIGAHHVFEMGSGYGYSAWWFARAVGPKGRVYCTDGDPENRDKAQEFLSEAGLWDRVSYEVGDATTALARQRGPFDIVFIDIDKEGYPAALEVAVNRVRPGGLIITDNTLWSGRVLDGGDGSPATNGVLEYTRRAREHPSLATTILPIRDGVAVSLRLPPDVLEDSPWRSISSK